MIETTRKVNCNLGDIFFTTSGGTPSRKNPANYIGNIPWVKSGELKFNTIIETEESISESALQNSSAKLFPKGTLLIALYGATIGKMAFLGIQAATNQAICGIFENKKMSLKFLYFYLYFKRPDLINVGIGGAQPNISQDILKQLVIPIYPLPEQRRIVAKIEELFSSLDKAIESLKTAQQQLKVYRQSVLKFAFEGKFTKDDNYGNKLASSWSKIKFIDFCKLQRGYDLPLKSIIPGCYPVVTSGGLNGYHSSFMADGPCLITGRSGGVGNIHYLDVDKYWPHNTVLFVKDFCGNHPKYIYYFFLQFDFKSFSSSTAIPTLDRKRLYNEVINVPPHSVQVKIVSEIESRLSVCDKIEETLEQSLKQSEALRQSILKKAFEGKLLSTAELDACRQEPDWQPASALLDQIKSEKSSSLPSTKKIGSRTESAKTRKSAK